MSPRFWILIVVAAGLVVYVAMRAPVPAKEEMTFDDGISEEERARIREVQSLLQDRDLPGEEPVEPADLSVRVEVETASGKNRLYYYITEAHGYYVETFDIEFHYKPTPDATAFDSPLVWNQFVNDYVKANETLVGCLEVVPAELDKVGGDIGTSENWGASIPSYGRARLQNPDPIPPLSRVAECD